MRVRQASERHDKQREELEQVMRFMTRNRCAPYLIDKVRHWLYYTFSPKTEEMERNAILQSLPRAMVRSFCVLSAFCWLGHGTCTRLDAWSQRHLLPMPTPARSQVYSSCTTATTRVKPKL